MQSINLFSTSSESRSKNVSAQKRLNCYLEQSDDLQSVVAYGMPGCDLFVNFGDSPIRKMYLCKQWIYVVYKTSLYRLGQNGNYTQYPLVLDTSTGGVDISDNGLQILIVDGISGYVLTLSTNVLEKITDVEFPICDTCTFMNGVSIVNETGSGRFFISSSYDSKNWDALDYATAEANPDNIIRVFTDHGQLYLMGEKTCEVWGFTGDLDFPFGRFNESTFEWGLAAKWSIAKFDNSFIWLAQNILGEVQVMQLNGGSPTRVSTFDIENIFNNYIINSDAIGFSYIYNGHPFYQLSFPTAEESYLYDGATGYWSKLKSEGINRNKYNNCIAAYNNIYASDYKNGNIYIIKEDALTENGDSIEVEIISKHVNTGLEKNIIRKLQVAMENGIGLQNMQGVDPILMLSISRDNGHTWGNENFLNIGRLGEYTARAVKYSLGQARAWTFKIRITAPIKKVITGIYIHE